MVGQEDMVGLEDIMLTCNEFCNARCKNPISESRVFFGLWRPRGLGYIFFFSQNMSTSPLVKNI